MTYLTLPTSNRRIPTYCFPFPSPPLAQASCDEESFQAIVSTLLEALARRCVSAPMLPDALSYSGSYPFLALAVSEALRTLMGGVKGNSWREYLKCVGEGDGGLSSINVHVFTTNEMQKEVMSWEGVTRTHCDPGVSLVLLSVDLIFPPAIAPTKTAHTHSGVHHYGHPGGPAGAS